MLQGKRVIFFKRENFHVAAIKMTVNRFLFPVLIIVINNLVNDNRHLLTATVSSSKLTIYKVIVHVNSIPKSFYGFRMIFLKVVSLSHTSLEHGILSVF